MTLLERALPRSWRSSAAARPSSATLDLVKFLGRRIRQVPARGVRGLESAGVVRGAFSRFRDPLAGGSLEYLDGSRRVG
jgi:hypothetical protein